MQDNSLFLVILVLIIFLLLIFKSAMVWKAKADIYDKKEQERMSIYTMNYDELSEYYARNKFTIATDYFFDRSKEFVEYLKFNLFRRLIKKQI